MIITRKEIIKQLFADYNEEIAYYNQQLKQFDNVQFENMRCASYIQYKILNKKIIELVNKLNDLRDEFKTLKN